MQVNTNGIHRLECRLSNQATSPRPDDQAKSRLRSELADLFDARLDLCDKWIANFESRVLVYKATLNMATYLQRSTSCSSFDHSVSGQILGCRITDFGLIDSQMNGMIDELIQLSPQTESLPMLSKEISEWTGRIPVSPNW
jgi:hypothetical protein